MIALETALNDRILRFDGINIVNADDIAYCLFRGIKSSEIHVHDANDPQVIEFNKQVPETDAIKQYVQDSEITIDFEWRIPQEYLQLNLLEYIEGKFSALLPELNYSDDQVSAAIERIAFELDEIETRGMTNFMQTVIYILDELKRTDKVWGVGRGSSCACYLLFIIGLHVVDCIKMEINAEEFFHD